MNKESLALHSQRSQSRYDYAARVWNEVQKEKPKNFGLKEPLSGRSPEFRALGAALICAFMVIRTQDLQASASVESPGDTNVMNNWQISKYLYTTSSNIFCQVSRRARA
ncbi:hypothetical protein BU25DRAFT_70784 [Macroventuria anomochaeta]|uniref:Uncharacterized protein n=1 Tax=Macroventuria anomochaeta TaxID=301207 RepID=A0ACB6RZJ2_9PLEO|nr:uncharacterized protein BU25DRAFT_70784 [Macroventuria anomochaeta]KAF2627199.1 hypothetical protein BU25DRAFT_70784 [Macroventuria anomochaeta]